MAGADQFDAYEHHDQGKVIMLRAPDDLDADRALGEALDALDAIVRPLAVEARFGCFDAELPVGDLHLGESLLVVARELGEVEPPRSYVGSRRDERHALGRESVQEWLAGSAPRCAHDPRHEVRWSEVLVHASAARLHSLADRSVLRVRATERPGLVHAIAVHLDDRGAWVLGPTGEMTRACMSPPIRYSLTQELGVTLHLELHWSPWTHAGSPERLACSAAVERLVARGWTLEFESAGYG